MSLFRVKYLSFFFILVSVFSFLNIIYSYYFNLYLNLNTYYFSLFSSLVIGLIFYKIKEINKKPNLSLIAYLIKSLLQFWNETDPSILGAAAKDPSVRYNQL